MRFNFTGTVHAETQDKTKKTYFLKEGVTEKKEGGKGGKPYVRVNLSVESSKNNRGFVESFGMEQDKIKTFDNDSKAIEIDWEDRFDAEVLKMVKSKKIMNFIPNERKEFISDWDVTNYLRDNIFELDKKKVTITGQVKPNFYNGVRDNFVIENVYLADDNADVRLTIFGTFFFTKESFDLAEWAESKKIIINGFTMETVQSEKENKFKGKMYVPKTLIFDCSKVDFENADHVATVNYRLHQMGLSYEDGKIKIDLKRDKVYSSSVVITYVNGQEEVEFNESELTENQKMAIDLGLRTLDDFKPKGSIYGKRKVEYKLRDFNINGDFKDGCVALDDTMDEFEERIYVPAAPETAENAVETPEEKPSENQATVTDLFD